jgi:hypothetical protein
MSCEAGDCLLQEGQRPVDELGLLQGLSMQPGIRTMVTRQSLLDMYPTAYKSKLAMTRCCGEAEGCFIVAELSE